MFDGTLLLGTSLQGLQVCNRFVVCRGYKLNCAQQNYRIKFQWFGQARDYGRGLWWEGEAYSFGFDT